MPATPTVTWRKLIELASGWLESHNVPDPEIAAELLAARLLGVGRGFLVSWLDREADRLRKEAMRRGMKRLAAGEPIQYVLGEWEFRKLTVTCDRRALIPRPDTESIVDLVLKCPAARKAKPVVVDVCTGSGVIILSLAQEMHDGVFVGLDISPDAIALARENAARNNLSGKVTFAIADGLDDLDESESIDILVSNPPYIPSAKCETLDPRIRDWEPRLALDGGREGLDFYERFTTDAVHLLRPGGSIFYEIGDGQSLAVRDLLREAGFDDIKICLDEFGMRRFVTGTLA